MARLNEFEMTVKKSSTIWSPGSLCCFLAPQIRHECGFRELETAELTALRDTSEL